VAEVPRRSSTVALLRSSTVALLKAAYSLTHRLNAAERGPGADDRLAFDLRSQRDLIDAEILRRAGEQRCYLCGASVPADRDVAVCDDHN
jgi:hypothetical protein